MARDLAALGYIAERSDFDDAREYPDPRREVALIERHVRLRGKDVLEVGCGNGRLTLAYAARAKTVVAIDPAATQLRRARARAREAGLAHVRFAQRPAQTGIRGGPYDVVLFAWSLCWISHTGMVDALRDAAAVLRPGGAVVEVRPAVSYTPTLWIRRGGRRLRVGTMTRRPDPEIRLAEEATRAVLRDRSFALVARLRRTWPSAYAAVSDLDRMFRANPGWSFPRATRRRLAELWRDGDTLELGRVLSLVILRPRAAVPAGRRPAIR